MTDFSFENYVTRGAVAKELAGNIEQAAWVFAEFAESVSPGSTDFDDFMDFASGLGVKEQVILHDFCQRVAQGLA
jgi:hypothetical protein